MTVGVALIGSGIFAKEEHLPAVQKCSRLSLKAIYSRSLVSAKGLAEGLSSVDLYSEDSGPGKGYEDVLKRSDVQAVIIALPILVQPEFIQKAILAGKHVLAEKPVAKDIATAEELLKWYHANRGSSSWSVAENYRFIPSTDFMVSEIKKLGKVLGVRVRESTLVLPGGKYFETSWRKNPSHQGGFVLDAGVHYVAAMRQLLGPQNVISKVSAFTNQLREYLPPLDTLDATLQTTSGVTGTFSVSMGTTWVGSEYTVACEGGTVTKVNEGSAVTQDGDETLKVVVKRGEEEEVTEFPNETFGVEPEVAAWAEALEKGHQDLRQLPEEALKDLTILEKMFKSGEQGGSPQIVPN